MTATRTVLIVWAATTLGSLVGAIPTIARTIHETRRTSRERGRD